jgi:hypothetical protein
LMTSYQTWGQWNIHHIFFKNGFSDICNILQSMFQAYNEMMWIWGKARSTTISTWNICPKIGGFTSNSWPLSNGQTVLFHHEIWGTLCSDSPTMIIVHHCSMCVYMYNYIYIHM